jgi:hypothetical protein
MELLAYLAGAMFLSVVLVLAAQRLGDMRRRR